MPRRTATPATPAPPAPLPPPPRDPAILAESDPQWATNLATLRRHWKWANFSQFFYTFAPLLAMPDVFLADIEDDLARGTNLFLPRVMHRLLYTLSQDRKITIDNWQSALRRQYLRRAPELNPIGPEPKVPSRESSVAPSEPAEKDSKVNADADTKPADRAEDANAEQADGKDVSSEQAEPTGESSSTKLEPHEDSKVPSKANSEQPRLKTEEREESKDWLELPMLAKLDSLQLLTDWQFHNPYKVRQIMKDDDDAANWRIEPIGYDAKTNAYWLIGPDRLWIQRVPPKPPRARKRKRPAPTPKKASTSKAAAAESSDDDDDDEPVTRSKRTRTQSNATKSSSQAQSRSQANGRATRASRRQTRASSPAPELSSPGKSTRAAKVQANKKLDMQAKELAEFQRQAAREAKAHASPRASRRAPPSPAKRAVGTRVSARLRRSTRVATDEDGDDDDAEWQEVPDEWLQGDENPTPSRRSSARTRATKGKARAVEEDEDEDEAEAEEAEEADADGETDAGGEKDDEQDAGDVAGNGDADGHKLLQKAGLESDAESDLTDLSEDPQKPDEEDVQMAEPEDDDNSSEEAPAPAKSRNARTRSRKSTGGGGRRKSARQTRKAPPRAREKKVALQEDVQPDAQEEEPKEDEQEQPPHEDEPAAPELPADFVEWEAIAVTLPEWEHVADRFANATHYLEKALYKTLTQHIVPVVTAELREHEKRRRLEEAIVHRKRSSRIALKESEKEEARLAAKKRAEEEEKMARARRQEARLKKEEAERAKRERAREQRAKEREEREARARAKAERAESKDVDTSAARSTATPTVNGTQPSSVQPSRVVTPNGVRSPDWVLDCEICHKQGVNVVSYIASSFSELYSRSEQDDGLPMVSCGYCNRWQHIPCHDLNDQRSGRPRRNWEEQQFYCSHCRARATNGGGTYGSHAQGYPAPSQYSWSQAARTAAVPKPMGVDPYAQTSDLRYSHRSPLENGSGYPQQQQYSANHVGAASYSRPSYPNNGFSFPHYQSDQRGVPSRGAPLPPLHSSGWGNGSGYPSPADHLNGRMQSTQFAAQYAHTGGAYANSSRVPSTYQASRLNPSSPYDAPSMSAARWPSTSATNGYHSTPTAGNAVQAAAESLAYMHDTGSRYNGSSSSWPAQQSYGHGQSSMHSFSQSGHASQHGRSSYPQSQLSPVDPLASHAYPAPRAEQHVGSSLPGGGSSFNFPS
ncbi:hypothetical protein C8Q70DRAFT_936899 [Cubamyces menziesii]|nr:hypothetical protein C8Q70DRAFT_936899 [Cubamyces menziesii]